MEERIPDILKELYERCRLTEDQRRDYEQRITKALWRDRAEVVLTMKAEPGGTTIERGGDTANDGPGSQPTTSGTTVKTTPTANGGTTETSVGTTGGDTQKTDGPSTNLVPIDPTVPDGTTGRTACKGNDAEPTDGQVTNPPTVEILSPRPPSVVANERKRR